ncbi:(-)-germacrene D synthase-like isoform X2 [Argentina anserina]|uniref:(-)-germacrene D synthase-like isoform X2 n=1 Tax=Argentina anserina TaxID=57926 RepID=UPI00217626DB|nr:(-)-germacrene D synthase-like isoform X2 [Potentilla anserina]
MSAQNTIGDETRPSADFPPGIRGDIFLSDAFMTTIVNCDQDRLQEMKEEVKRMVTAPFEKQSQILQLIDDIQRLGVAYLMENEISQVLQQIHDNFSGKCLDDQEENDDNLYTAALRFRLLRQQGYKVSCDTFNNFKDGDGKFSQSHVGDVLGLLSLYEASQLRIHGEEILDEAVNFSTTHLELAIHGLLPPLSKRVSHALYQPLWKGFPRLEVRHYLSMYEEGESHNETLLTFAKLDFNRLQQVYQKELPGITRWWKDLDFEKKLPFARSRVIEAYFWALGLFYLPENHVGRMMMCKIIAIITIIDDIYDAHGKYGELELFTEVVERWDVSAMDPLPEYMNVCYQAMMDVYTEFEETLAKEGNLYRMQYAREAMKLLTKAYLTEAKWFNNNYIPTMSEYMPVALFTSYHMLATMSFIGMGDIVTKDSLDWVFSDPKMLKAASVICRLMDDRVSHEFEQKRGHVASAVECYMKEHDATREEALIEFRIQVNNAWKDINEALLQPTIFPVPVLSLILNLARVIEVIYKYEDGYTHSGIVLKDYIESLLIEPVPLTKGLSFTGT